MPPELPPGTPPPVIPPEGALGREESLRTGLSTCRVGFSPFRLRWTSISGLSDIFPPIKNENDFLFHYKSIAAGAKASFSKPNPSQIVFYFFLPRIERCVW